MTHTAAEAIAGVASRLVRRRDIAGDLVALLVDCTNLLDARAAGLLVQVPDDGLELLSSSSHQATELELYELQHGAGPCIEALSTGRPRTVTSPELDTAWDPVGARIVAAGFHTVHAFPLRWHDTLIGALNIFQVDPTVLDAERHQLAQTFADLATAVLAQPLASNLPTLQRQITDALNGRSTIEQAKGVLAYREDVGLAEAFQLLLRTATSEQRTLSEVAADVVASTYRR